MVGIRYLVESVIQQKREEKGRKTGFNFLLV